MINTVLDIGGVRADKGNDHLKVRQNSRPTECKDVTLVDTAVVSRSDTSVI